MSGDHVKQLPILTRDSPGGLAALLELQLQEEPILNLSGAWVRALWGDRRLDTPRRRSHKLC
jgi:hypothetical protein